MRPNRYHDSKGNPIKGVRPSFQLHPDLHAKAVKAAKARGESFTDFMVEAIESALKKGKTK